MRRRGCRALPRPLASSEKRSAGPNSERVARLAVEKLALLAASAALNQVTPRHAELFAATRLASTHPGMYGAVDLDVASMRTLLERALQ